MIYVLAYLGITLPLLILLTGRKGNLFPPSRGQKIDLVMSALTVAVTGLPLFLAGAVCTWLGLFDTSTSGGYNWAPAGLIFSLPSLIGGAVVCYQMWKHMRALRLPPPAPVAPPDDEWSQPAGQPDDAQNKPDNPET